MNSIDFNLNEPTASPHDFVEAMAVAAHGVSIVTTQGQAGRFGLTVSAVTSVSAEPPILLACINRKNRAEQAITINKRFAVNLLAENQAALARSFSGRPRQGLAYDFSQAQWLETPITPPLLIGAAAVFDCELESYHDVGTHRIFIGRVLRASQSGHMPLVYSHRKFGKFDVEKS